MLLYRLMATKTTETFEELLRSCGVETHGDERYLASHCGVSLRTLYNIRYGLRNPFRATRAQISKGLRVPLARVDAAIAATLALSE